MKKFLKWVKRLALGLVTLVLLVIIPVGVAALIDNIQLGLKTESEKRLEDVKRLQYLIEHEFGGYNTLPTIPNFYKQIDRLKILAHDSKVTTEKFNLELIKAVSALKDPHTAVYNIRDIFDQQFAYQLAWYENEFFLTSGKVDKKWIGAKVTKFGNVSPSTAYEQLVSYTFAPNEAGSAYFLSLFQNNPHVLYEEGINNSLDAIVLTLQLETGETIQQSFPSMPRNQLSQFPDYKRFSDKFADMQPLLKNSNPGKNYWYDYLENDNTIYFRYAMAVEQGNIEQFWHELFAELDQKKPVKLVIDIRGNPGGDTQNHITLVHELSNRPHINKKGKLFVLIDRGTGSAAVSLASELEKKTDAIFVGEKTMDRPSTTSDPTFFTLPNSGLKILIPSLYSLHSYVADQRYAILPDIEISENIYGDNYLIDEVLDSVTMLSIEDFNQDLSIANLPDQLEGTYQFSDLRNLNLSREAEQWIVSIDGLISFPVFEVDSINKAIGYPLEILGFDSVKQSLSISIHGQIMNSNKLASDSKSIVKLIELNELDQLQSRIEALKQNSKLPPYMDRPFFQSLVYQIYKSQGFERAFALNQLTKSYFPGDPVLSIVDYELYEYDNQTFSKYLTVFPILGKLINRYFMVAFSDKIMNDDYNAFIGR